MGGGSERSCVRVREGQSDDILICMLPSFASLHGCLSLLMLDFGFFQSAEERKKKVNYNTIKEGTILH